MPMKDEKRRLFAYVTPYVCKTGNYSNPNPAGLEKESIY